jgi:putative ABC transport system permease protein
LTLIGITLGLATVVATRLTSRTVGQAYSELYEGAIGESALEVTSPTLSSFDPNVLPDLKSFPGVREVSVRIRGAVGIAGHNGSVTAALLGVDLVPGSEEFPVIQGGPLQGRDDVLLDAGLAESLGLFPGQSLKVWGPAGLVSLQLAGFLQPRGASAGTGGIIVASLDTACRLLDFPPQHVNCLRVMLEDEADPARVQQALSQSLPPSLLIHAPGAESGLARPTLMSARQGLSALGVLALCTAGFVILNTFLLNLSERRRQLAILKTLGATRSQVLLILLGEAVILGLLGALLGCLVGTGLAVVLLRAMERFLGVGMVSLHPDLATYLLACLLGPAVPLLAAFIPAWQASKRPPLAELLPHRGDEREVSTKRVGIIGMLLFVLGLVPATGFCRGWFSDSVAQALLPPALGFLLGSSVLLFPLLLPWLLRVFEILPLRLEGTLALQQLARHRTRTGLAAGILFLSVTVTAGFGQSLRGILRELRGWYRHTIVADFLVRGSMPDTSFVLATALPESLGDDLVRLDGVAAVDRIAFLPAVSSDREILILARTFPVGGRLPLDLREGDMAGVRQGLMHGEIVLGTGLAGQLNRHRGDHFTLTTSHGPMSLHIAGTAAEFAGGGAALYMEWGTARRLFDVPGVHVFLVSARPGCIPVLTPALRHFCEQRHLLVQSNADLRELIGRLLSRVTGAIWSLMVLVFVVASLGTVNTLQMNVQDQARTFVLLRALGLKRRQVRKLVLAQALLLGGLSLLPGVLAGLGLSYVISRGSASGAGVSITFRPDVVVLAVACGIALGSTLLASLLPARKAARLSVIEGLS